MNIEVKTVKQTINKAYFIQNVFDNDMFIFKQNLETLLTSINQNDSEESLKDYINKFLDNTFYKNKFFIKENVNNIDLVINTGKKSDDRIGVIIETKAIKNSLEMITEQDFNKKAFHEIIQYYLEERIINQNLEIKQLIITNSIDWFIFDALEFERVFVKTGHALSLQKQYNSWYSGKLVSKNKDFFYSEIIKPFIENSDETIVCTHFNLNDYAKSLHELSHQNQLKLIELYKIFSPEHILKLPFANDSNTLNREFYNELLYIIGLYENNDKIERLPAKKRNEGSLIENAINIITEDDILDKIQNTPSFENLFELNKEEQLFSIGLELCITWLNRIIFLKLLESQLIVYNKNKDLAFLNIDNLKNFNDLKELFFEVLSIPINERKERFAEKYKNIPYLNSSLFEASQIEKDTIRINQLATNLEIPIFNATVLKDEHGKKITGSKQILPYIFEFLDSYNFGSDAHLEIQQSNKTLINSSVLGLIFEKINGYQDGSFFTPGYITMYMSRQSIRKSVIQKFKTALQLTENNDFETTWTELYNKIPKLSLHEANKIFNTIKICDISVGSGHFLVSALNELIAIKSELGLIIDKDGKNLRKTYCEVVNDELFVIYNGEAFIYDIKDKESQRIQETLFHEKQTLIENCLFGVDINPKSVNICRLRLWIELLKNAYYTPKTNFKELETLPNIDINIKCGNSLVSFFDLAGNGFKNGQLSKVQNFTKEYKAKVSLYKELTDKNRKTEIVNHINLLKKQFMDFANPNDKEYKDLSKKKVNVSKIS